MNTKQIFDIAFESFQAHIFGKQPYLAGQLEAVKQFAQQGVITYAEAQERLLILAKQIDTKTGDYSLFGG